MVVNALGESKLLIKEETPADYYGPSEVVSRKTKGIDIEECGVDTANQTMNARSAVGRVHESAPSS